MAIVPISKAEYVNLSWNAFVTGLQATISLQSEMQAASSPMSTHLEQFDSDYTNAIHISATGEILAVYANTLPTQDDFED